MKKSRAIQLVLITSLLASCNRQLSEDMESRYSKEVPSSDTVSADTTAYYYNPSLQLWYYGLGPSQLWYNGAYHNANPYFNRAYQTVNKPYHPTVIGEASVHSSVLRGGFGGSHFSVSS
jgi:hypothetical protein